MPMIRISRLIAVASLVLLAGCYGLEDLLPDRKAAPRPAQPYEGPAPVVVVVEHDPWLFVMGSDTPTFALYEDRTVVLAKNRLHKAVEGNILDDYLYAKLSEDEYANLLKSFALSPGYYALKDRYKLSNATDQPETIIYTNIDGRKKLVSVYGSIRHKADIGPRVYMSDSVVDSLPKELETLFNRAIYFRSSNTVPWQPRYIEVLVSRSLPLSWPSDWPDLNSPMTWDRGRAYSVYLPGEKLPAFRTYLAEKKPSGLQYRFVFPQDGVWYGLNKP